MLGQSREPSQHVSDYFLASIHIAHVIYTGLLNVPWASLTVPIVELNDPALVGNWDQFARGFVRIAGFSSSAFDGCSTE
eukprot:1398642-Prymnesium_polylepis.2